MQPRRKKRGRDKSDVFQGDAHAFLMMVYKDPSLPLALRLDAAKAAIPFEKPALAGHLAGLIKPECCAQRGGAARSCEENPRHDN